MSASARMTTAARHADTSVAPEFPPGVHLRPLQAFSDARGTLAECFRTDWPEAMAPAQWVSVISAANVLRGVHVHLRHTDWLVVLDGRLLVALHDLRAGSPAHGRTQLMTLDGAAPAGLRIPPGVAHGLFSPVRAVYLLGADRPYDLADELGCHWRDPDLGIDWPFAAPLVSARDEALGRVGDLALLMPAWEAER